MSARTDAGPGVPADPFPQYETDEEVDAHVGAGGSVATHEAASDPHPQYDTAAEVAQRVTDHESLSDPHPQYDTAAEAQTAVDTHAGASDPHTGYLKETELGRTYNVRSVTTGTSDDTSAIQGLHDAAADGDTIFVQPGTYTVSQLNWTKKVNIVGLGTPENVVFKAKSGMTGPLLNVSFGALKHHLRIENLYVDMQLATGQVGVYLNNLDLGTISNVKVREGTVGFDIDSVAATDFNQCWAFNTRTSGFRVKNAAALDNTYNRCFVYMTSGAAADMSVGFDIQAGGSNYLNGVRVLRDTSSSHFMPYGIKCDSALTTDWLFLNNVVVDGITDGTGANSATSAGMYLLNCTGVFSSNSFYSANSSSGQKQRGVLLDGGSRFSFVGGRISGSGMGFANTVDTVDVRSVDFPSNFSDPAFTFGSATVTNLSYNFAPPGGAIADDNTLLSVATASTKGYIGSGRRMLVSDNSAAEAFILEHPSTGKTKRIRVNNGSTGTLEFMADNGTTKILQLTDSGRLHISSGTNQEIAGSGSPEGVLTATVGSTYRRTDGSAGTSWYVKESGTGNTGWVAYVSGSAAIAPTTLDVPTATSPSQSLEGRMIWDSDDDRLTIGDGSSRKTLMNTDTSLASSQLPALTGDVTSSAGSASTTLAAGSATNLNSGTLPAGRLPALSGDVTSSAGSASTTLAAGSASNLNSGTLAAGRLPALTGNVTSSAGSAATTLAAGSASNLDSGTLLAARMPALTGDVTTSAGAVATTIAAAHVTGPMLSLVPDTRPNVNGLLAWTEDPLMHSSNKTPLGATIYLRKIMVPTSITFANLLITLSTNGTNYTNTQLGIYSSAGTLLGASAVLASGGTNTFGSGATAVKSVGITVIGGQSLAVTGGDAVFVWAAIHMGTNASTAATFVGSATGVAQTNATIGVSTSRAGTFTGHATNDLATIGNITPGSISQSAPLSIWFGAT